MVLNNDPRKVLELFNTPVDRDEDDFLDKMDSVTAFQAMPSKPLQSIDSLQGITNTSEAALLLTTDEIEEHKRELPDTIACEMTEKQRRFFALFKDTMNEAELQASVPDSLDLAAVQKVIQAKELPTVETSKEEKEEELEDLARRAAYLAMQNKIAEDPKYTKYHDRFVAFYKKEN
jgi:hypothetical protein